ncbi:MAG: hypothetical protein HXS48_00710 [Theionarchaea archaeon]|nr:hypothetical protein [Theionarchaea archaeon]
MRVVDAARVKEIIEKYRVLLKDNRVYFKDNIPEEKLKNAIEKYADISHDETPLLLIDDTILGSGKEGAVFTEKRILGKRITKDKVLYSYINSAELVDQKIFINCQQFFSVFLVDEPNRLRVCNMIREIIGTEPQKAVISGKKWKNLRKKNKNLKKENKYLKKRLIELQKANYMPPETLAQLKAELRKTEEKCNELEATVKKQQQKIETVQSELENALKKSEEEKSLLEQEVETLRQEVETLKDALQQTQLQRQRALNSLTPKERYIYHYVVRQKGTVNIAQLMKIKRYTTDDIFKIFNDLESKGLVGRIVGELNAGKRFTSRE